MNMHMLARAAALIALSCAGTAMAANKTAYMSGYAEPWGSSSNLQAMDAAFGAGSWDRVDFQTAFTGYDFLYVDGSDNAGYDFKSFVDSQRSALESFVKSGGRLVLNAATNGLQGIGYQLVFGATTQEAGIGYSGQGHAVDAGHPLFDNAGTDWSGNYFAHNAIGTDASFTSFVTGDNGQTIVAGGVFGKGYALLGGQTASSFHTGFDTGAPLQLRVNELRYAANVAIAPVPEPSTYALLAAGLGVVGFVARRRQVL